VSKLFLSTCSGKPVLTLLKSCAQTSHTPSQVYHNLTIRMMKSAHDGAYSNGLFACFLKFRFEVVVREGIKAIKMSCLRIL